MADAMITARMIASKKAAGNQVFEKLGSTPPPKLSISFMITSLLRRSSLSLRSTAKSPPFKSCGMCNSACAGCRRSSA